MIYCSFCGKDNHQVKKLIQGMNQHDITIFGKLQRDRGNAI